MRKVTYGYLFLFLAIITPAYASYTWSQILFNEVPRLNQAKEALLIASTANNYTHIIGNITLAQQILQNKNGNPNWYNQTNQKGNWTRIKAAIEENKNFTEQIQPIKGDFPVFYQLFEDYAKNNLRALAGHVDEAIYWESRPKFMYAMLGIQCVLFVLMATTWETEVSFDFLRKQKSSQNELQSIERKPRFLKLRIFLTVATVVLLLSVASHYSRIIELTYLAVFVAFPFIIYYLRRTAPWDTTATAVFVLLALTPLFQGFLEMAFHIIYQLPIITAAINVLLLVAIAVKLKLASFQKKQIFSISS